MRSVYLVGLNHKYQLGLGGAIPVEGTPEEFAEFEQFMRDSIDTYRVRAIAEEMSPAALKKHFISGDSVPCRLAGVAGLAHRYCDPDPETRKRLNIESNDQRERYWIQELTSLDVFPVLFVLGGDHIDSFSTLLREGGFTASTVVRDWQPSPEATQAA
jgi:hypothetical protein